MNCNPHKPVTCWAVSQTTTSWCPALIHWCSDWCVHLVGDQGEAEDSHTAVSCHDNLRSCTHTCEQATKTEYKSIHPENNISSDERGLSSCNRKKNTGTQHMVSQAWRVFDFILKVQLFVLPTASTPSRCNSLASAMLSKVGPPTMAYTPSCMIVATPSSLATSIAMHRRPLS